MKDYEYVTIHDSAVTNTGPDSMVTVVLDRSGPPICHNMTDQEFRKIVLTLRDEAVESVESKVQELTVWNAAAQARITQWFGIQADMVIQLAHGWLAITRIVQ